MQLKNRIEFNTDSQLKVNSIIQLIGNSLKELVELKIKLAHFEHRHQFQRNTLPLGLIFEVILNALSVNMYYVEM